MKEMLIGRRAKNGFFLFACILVCYTPFLVSSRKLLLGGALRDDPKNGCVADYLHIGLP